MASGPARKKKSERHEAEGPLKTEQQGAAASHGPCRPELIQQWCVLDPTLPSLHLPGRGVLAINRTLFGSLVDTRGFDRPRQSAMPLSPLACAPLSFCTWTGRGGETSVASVLEQLLTSMLASAPSTGAGTGDSSWGDKPAPAPPERPADAHAPLSTNGLARLMHGWLTRPGFPVLSIEELASMVMPALRTLRGMNALKRR